MENLSLLLNKEKLTKQDMLGLLALDDEIEMKTLFAVARDVRDYYCGKKVHLRGIIEFSNYCAQDCNYCGIRKSKDSVERYRLTMEEIMEGVNLIYSSNVKTVVLQSGEDPYYDCEFLSSLIRRIKTEYGLAITLSLGEREFFEYDTWREDGADRYLLKHETANTDIYTDIHNGQDLKQRLQHLGYLQEIGFQIGSGNIIGLPGQTPEDIVDDILLCSQFELDMASFSPFLPAAGTPLGNHPPATVEMTLKTMAIARLVLKNTHIPATTALATLDDRGREKGIRCGANVVMPSFTPTRGKSNYTIYDNKRCLTEDPVACMPCLKARIESCGVVIDEGYGHSLKLEPVANL
jgi:biotin synthase